MPNSDDFITRATLQLRDLKRQDDALRAQEEGVRRKREELGARIAELEKSLTVYREVMELSEDAEPDVTLFGDVPMGTVADMAHEILKKRENPMKVAELTRILEGLGKLPHGGGTESARGSYATVYGSLSRDRRFVRTDQGEFDLATRRVSSLAKQLERFFDVTVAPRSVSLHFPSRDDSVVPSDEAPANDAAPLAGLPSVVPPSRREEPSE